MTRDEATRLLSGHLEDLRQRGAKNLYLFGSTARNEALPESDVDIIVEVDFESHAAFSLFDLIRIQHYLEDVLGSDVDLITDDGIRPQLKDRIHRERVLVA